MKEATGELSMTVIVIIGAIAIMGIVTFLVPKIKDYIDSKWSTITHTCGVGERWDNAQKQCVTIQ